MSQPRGGSQPQRRFRWLRLRFILVGFSCLELALSMGCATRSFRPAEFDSVGMRDRAQSETIGAVQVTTAVPSPDEAAALFGVPIYKRGIQPVWLEVVNGTNDTLRFAPVGVDREYFSPLEVAYVHRSGFSKKDRSEMERVYWQSTMPRFVPAGETRSGFVFTHAQPGTKAFNVDLFGPRGNDYYFTFFVQVPGFIPDHAEVEFDTLYASQEIVDLDVDGIRRFGTELACCTTDPTGEKSGAPLNILLIAKGEDLLQALLRAGWHETAGGASSTSGRDSQNWDGRRPDAVFRKKRGKGDERNELRLWLSPVRVEGESVWVAQVTHVLPKLLLAARPDPDIDDARNYLLQNLWYGQGLEKFGWLNTDNQTTFDTKQKSFDGSVFFTDGYRLVMWVSGAPMALTEAEMLNWNAFPD